MNHFRDCPHLIDVLSIRHNDLSCTVALRKIARAEYLAQLPECDVIIPGPGLAGDGDGGTAMILDQVTEDLDRAYKALADLRLQRPT